MGLSGNSTPRCAHADIPISDVKTGCPRVGDPGGQTRTELSSHCAYVRLLLEPAVAADAKEIVGRTRTIQTAHVEAQPMFGRLRVQGYLCCEGIPLVTGVRVEQRNFDVDTPPENVLIKQGEFRAIARTGPGSIQTKLEAGCFLAAAMWLSCRNLADEAAISRTEERLGHPLDPGQRMNSALEGVQLRGA